MFTKLTVLTRLLASTKDGDFVLANSLVNTVSLVKIPK